MTYERVYSLWDYYDGPRTGIADYRGRPHHYSSEWSATEDGYADTFILTPISDEALQLALEYERIWRKWRSAFDRGAVSQDSHPALPGQNQRFVELQSTLDKLVEEAPDDLRIRATGDFRPRKAKKNMSSATPKELEVEWREAD
jgi:hypothetical protein